MTNKVTHKVVTVKPTRPVYTVRPAIISTVLEMDMSITDIYHCLVAKAFVKEHLTNGKELPLNLLNYDLDNNSVSETAETETKKEEEIDHTISNAAKPDDQNENSSVKIGEEKKKEETKPEAPANDVKTSNADPKYFNGNKKQQEKINRGGTRVIPNATANAESKVEDKTTTPDSTTDAPTNESK